MGHSCSNTKKIIIFSQKKAFLIFSLEPCTFQPKVKKEKIIHPEKHSYISGNRPPLPPQKSYILRNGTFEFKALIFQEGTCKG